VLLDVAARSFYLADSERFISLILAIVQLESESVATQLFEDSRRVLDECDKTRIYYPEDDRTDFWPIEWLPALDSDVTFGYRAHPEEFPDESVLFTTFLMFRGVLVLAVIDAQSGSTNLEIEDFLARACPAIQKFQSGSEPAYEPCAGVVSQPRVGQSLLPEHPEQQPEFASVFAEDAPVAPANYILGLLTNDAGLLWDSYSDRSRSDLERRGVAREETQRHLDVSRQIGNAIQGAEYVGGYALPNGSMEFYVVLRSGRDGAIAYVPYVFTLDAEGKIDRID